MGDGQRAAVPGLSAAGGRGVPCAHGHTCKSTLTSRTPPPQRSGHGRLGVWCSGCPDPVTSVQDLTLHWLLKEPQKVIQTMVAGLCRTRSLFEFLWVFVPHAQCNLAP